MQLILLALVLGIFIHDYAAANAAPTAQAAPLSPLLSWPALLACAGGAKVLLGALYWAACVWTRRQLGGHRAARAVRALDWAGGGFRLIALGLYGMDLALGALLLARHAVGDGVLIDELLVLLPTLLLYAWGWWAYYPVERRIREAALIGRLDSGLPVYPIWTRPQYLLAQVRHQMALILTPALLLLGWMESVSKFAPAYWSPIEGDPRPLLLVAGAVTVFLLAPLIIRYLWDTVPLPEGEMRRRLLTMCEKHRVGVRELLLWRTFGGVINAAVMGLIAPLRYILLSDALLEMIQRDQVEAVMAHELAHVRRHHMFWLLAAAIGALGALELLFGALLIGAQETLLTPAGSDPALVRAGMFASMAWLRTPEAVILGTALLAGGSWIALFGWVSRRIERQADAFAVSHLATQRDAPRRDASGRVLIDGESVQVMVGALQQVAELNQMPTHKRSWRHGSIAWRQQYLRSLVGAPADAPPIDRQVRWIKVGAVGAIAVIIGAQFVLSQATGAALLPLGL